MNQQRANIGEKKREKRQYENRYNWKQTIWQLESGQSAQEAKFSVKILGSAKPERAVKDWRMKHSAIAQPVFYFLNEENEEVFLR